LNLIICTGAEKTLLFDCIRPSSVKRYKVNQVHILLVFNQAFNQNIESPSIAKPFVVELAMEVDDLELTLSLSETRNHIPDVFLKVSSLIAIVLVAKDQNYELRVVINKLLEKMHLRQIRYRFPIFIDLSRSN
jgi:hypothetical protein